MQKIIFISAHSVHPILSAYFCPPTYMLVDVSSWSHERILHSDHLPQLCGVITDTRLRVDRAFIDRAPQLKWVGRIGSGLDHIDLDALEDKHIRCISTPQGNAQALAEIALGQLISLLRNIHLVNDQVRQGVWARMQNRGSEIASHVVAVIGYGNMGSRFAGMLATLGVDVLAHDKYKPITKQKHIYPSSLQDIFRQASVVSLHLPLTAETTYYADDAFFEQFSSPIIFLNTSRGKIVDTRALLAAFRTGKVSHAALDVLENEDLHCLHSEQKQWFDELCAQKNILLSPHIAGYTSEAFTKMAQMLINTLEEAALV